MTSLQTVKREVADLNKAFKPPEKTDLCWLNPDDGLVHKENRVYTPEEWTRQKVAEGYTKVIFLSWMNSDLKTDPHNSIIVKPLRKEG